MKVIKCPRCGKALTAAVVPPGSRLEEVKCGDCGSTVYVLYRVAPPPRTVTLEEVAAKSRSAELREVAAALQAAQEVAGMVAAMMAVGAVLPLLASLMRLAMLPA